MLSRLRTDPRVFKRGQTSVYAFVSHISRFDQPKSPLVTLYECVKKSYPSLGCSSTYAQHSQSSLGKVFYIRLEAFKSLVESMSKLLRWSSPLASLSFPSNTDWLRCYLDVLARLIGPSRSATDDDDVSDTLLSKRWAAIAACRQMRVVTKYSSIRSSDFTRDCSVANSNNTYIITLSC